MHNRSFPSCLSANTTGATEAETPWRKNSGIQPDLRLLLQLNLMMRSSRVGPTSDGLRARL